MQDTKTSGTHILSSGNSMEWEQVSVAGRGSIRAAFTQHPDAIDMAEGHAFVASLAPPDVDVVGDEVVIGLEKSKAAMNQHLYGSSQN